VIGRALCKREQIPVAGGKKINITDASDSPAEGLRFREQANVFSYLQGVQRRIHVRYYYARRLRTRQVVSKVKNLQCNSAGRRQEQNAGPQCQELPHGSGHTYERSAKNQLLDKRTARKV